MMNREGILAKGLYSVIDRHVLPVVVRQGLTADQLSWAGLVWSAGAAVFFVFSPLLGSLLLLFAGLCDVLDGSLARANGTASKAGAFLDSVLDRYGEIFVFAGLWGYLFRSGQEAVFSTLVLLWTMAGSLMVSYTRARGEGLGVRCAEGLFQRGERIIILALGGFLEAMAPGRALLPVLLAVAMGTNITAMTRLKVIRRELLGRKGEENAGL